MGEFIFGLGEFRENRASKELPCGGYYIDSPSKKALTLIFHVELVVGGGGQKIIIL